MWNEVRKRYETDEIFRKKVDKVAKEWRALRGNRNSFESYVEIVLRNYEVSKSVVKGTTFARSDDEILQELLDSLFGVEIKLLLKPIYTSLLSVQKGQ